jgi:CDP-glycerol glycerophosphotransferase
MITLSIVVTALEVRGQVRDCLDSVLGLPAEDVEVVCVDAGAPPSVRALADEYARDDDRIRVIRAPDGATEGAARDAGAQAARGDYLWFLQGRDVVQPGALAALAGRTADADRPQVVVFDHVGSHWRGTTVGSADGPRFLTAGRDLFSIRERPEMLQLTPILANRVMRADFRAAYREVFDQDECAEVRPAMGSLLAADRIVVLDAVCVRRDESEPERVPARPSDLFTQYEALWALLERRAMTDEHRAVLFGDMVQRYLKVLTLPGMTEREEAEFFHRSAEHFLRYKPPGYERPASLNGVRHATLERGSYTTYRVLQTANRRRRAVRGFAVKAKYKAAEVTTERMYREQLRRPLDEELVVFSAYWDRGVACSPAAIAAKLAELAPTIRQVWVVRRQNVPLLPPGTDYVVPGSRRYWSVLARAKYLVNNVNFADGVIKRRGQVHLQTHHGTPLKRMGIDQIPYPATSRGVDYDALLERCARWDYSVSANRHSTEVWERAYPVPFVSLDYGYPRNDVYYTATADDVLRIRERLAIAPGRKAVLYAPTHRDYESAWSPRLDLERLAGVLGPEFVLLVRGHYFYDRGPSPLEELHRRGLIIDVSAYDSVEELGLAADALITDYSSVMFDYANLDRPIVVLADDWETYSVTRGVYFHLPTCSPGPVASSQEEIERILLTDRWRDARATAQREAFRRRFCDYDDGHAAERVVRHVFLGEPGVPEVVPLERRTPAPAPPAAAALFPAI